MVAYEFWTLSLIVDLGLPEQSLIVPETLLIRFLCFLSRYTSTLEK
jgi:hypothetical protein